MPRAALLGFAALLLATGAIRAEDDCPETFPFTDTIPEFTSDQGTPVSVGSEVADLFAESNEREGSNQVEILGFNRDFVACISRLVQGLAEDAEASERVGATQNPLVEAVRTALRLPASTRYSGWGFESTKATSRVVRLLIWFYNPNSNVAASTALCADLFGVRSIPLTLRSKLDPSIELAEGGIDLLVTRRVDCTPSSPQLAGAFDENRQARVHVRTRDDICTLAHDSCVRSIERFPVLGFRSGTVGHADHAAEAANAEHTARLPMPGKEDVCTAPILPPRFTGQGQIAGLIDTPLDPQHCAFADVRPIGPDHRKIVFDGSTGDLYPPIEARVHGTMVASLLAGEPPSGDPTLRGAAPGAKLAVSPIGLLSEAAIREALERQFTSCASVFSISWGDDRCRKYERGCASGPLTRAFDNFAARHEDALIVAAVSNGATIAMPENGRNVLAVAAAGGEGRECTRFVGATGPSALGQWKPELLSRGCHVKAAVPGSGCQGDSAAAAIDPATGEPIARSCATSWAAPALAGAALDLREFLANGCFDQAGCQTTPVCTPSAAQLKSLLIAGGTLPKTVAPGPSEGWGTPNVGPIARPKKPIFLVDVRNRDFRYALPDRDPTTGQPYWAGPYEVELNPSGRKTRVALSWTQPPYGPGVAFPIPSDLDLIVVAYRRGWFVGAFSGDDPHSTNTNERVTIPGRLHADRIEIYVRAWRVLPSWFFFGFQGYALSAVGAVKSPVSLMKRGDACETATPRKPTLVAPNLPFKFLPSGSRAW